MVRAKVVTVIRWYAQDDVNQKETEQNEVDGWNEEGSWFHKKGDAVVKNAEKVLTSASSGIHVTHPHTKHTVPDQKSEDDQNYTRHAQLHRKRQ